MRVRAPLQAPKNCMEKVKVTPEIIATWFRKAEGYTGSLDEFHHLISQGYEHTPQSIVCACAAIAIAGAYKVGTQDQFSITPQHIMWEFVANFLHIGGPMNFVNYTHMLDPAKAHEYEQVISTETFDWLKKQARLLIAKNVDEIDEAKKVPKEVQDHWMSIADGKAPFGFSVRYA